jgi:outer membrane receptor for ferrienterochelin and colicin
LSLRDVMKSDRNDCWNMQYLFALILFFMLQKGHAAPEKDDPVDLSYGTGDLPSIALGRPAPENLSPSVTSVMTSKDIERIGARRIQDVLEYLPGVHVGNVRNGLYTIGFRGVYSENNSQVLVLVNGIPMRNSLIGGRPFLWTMPVKNISHIEVIRGPGSMLYGGDATTGVINVVLKTGKQLQGGDTGGFFGSQDTYEGWAEYGNQNGDWEYSLSLQGGSTNGNRGRIQQDAQTVLDRQFRTNLSNAPGFSNNGRDDMDARLDVAYKDWARLRVGYQLYNKVQSGEGAALALDDGTGRNDEQIYNVDLSFTHGIADNLDGKTTFYYLGQDQKSGGFLLPRGTFGGLLPQGLVQNFRAFQSTAGLTNQFNFTGFDKHTVTFGAGANHTWITDGSNKTNAIITPTLIQQIDPTEVSRLGKDPLLSTKDRTNFYALIQDEWNFATDWYFTTGFRYDYYSDVAPGLSPRAGLVWNVSPSLTTKLLYSRAFRPPSFLEKNQPFTQGKDIKPETVNTVELQVENQWQPNLKTSANVFWYQIDNLITSTRTAGGFVPVGFSNSKPLTGLGMETEAQYSPNEDLSFTVNYSYHSLTNSPATGFMPEHMIKGLVNWEFAKDWVIGGQFDWIGERKRPSNDPRPNLDSYFIAGLTLSTKITKPVEFTLRVNNLFNDVAKEPSVDPVSLPGDAPILGRSILGQAKWTF